MKEIWKSIEGYEGRYEISSKGRVKSLPKNGRNKALIMKPNISGKQKYRTGYCRIGLTSEDGIETRILVHRLVAKAFIPNPENKPQVNHLNGNGVDNRVENLQWVDNTRNCLHAFETKLNKHQGENHENARFTTREVAFIRFLFENDCNISRVQISKFYKVSRSSINRIVDNTRRRYG